MAGNHGTQLVIPRTVVMMGMCLDKCHLSIFLALLWWVGMFPELI